MKRSKRKDCSWCGWPFLLLGCGGIESFQTGLHDDAEEHTVEKGAMRGNEVATSSTYDAQNRIIQRIDIRWLFL